jgi:hypothetical protein
MMTHQLSTQSIRRLLTAMMLLPLLLAPSCGTKQNHSAGSVHPQPAAKDVSPRTLPELNAWYVEPPAGQNAASFYSAGLDALRFGNVSASNLPLLGRGVLEPQYLAAVPSDPFTSEPLQYQRKSQGCALRSAGPSDQHACREPLRKLDGLTFTIAAGPGR